MANRPLLPPIPEPTGRADRKGSQRLRLFDALAELISEDGWGAVTASKLAASAGVSTRAFYEHFADKEECLLAAYDEMSAVALVHLREHAGTELGWRERIAEIVTRWFALLASEPRFTRIYAIEIWSVSAATRRRARAGTTVLVEQIRQANLAAHAADARVAVLQDDELQMLVGGMHRLVVLATIDGRIAQLVDAAPAVTRTLSAAISRRA